MPTHNFGRHYDDNVLLNLKAESTSERKSDTFNRKQSVVPENIILQDAQHEGRHLEPEFEDLIPSAVRISEDKRVVKFLSLLPMMSEGGEQDELSLYHLYNALSVWLAWSHVRKQDWRLLPGVGDRLGNCDLQFDLEMRDSRFSTLQSTKELLDIFIGSDKMVNATMHSSLPVATIGAAYSSISDILSSLNSAFLVTQASSSSASSSDDEDSKSFPLSVNFLPSNDGSASAMAAYLKYQNVLHIGVLYMNDSYGITYHAHLLREANLRGIQVVSVGYSLDNVDGALDQLSKSDMRYIVGILDTSSWIDVMRRAANLEIMGVEGYTWLLTESVQETVTRGFTLNRANDSLLARALNGVGVLLVDYKDNKQFDVALDDFRNSSIEEDFLPIMHSPDFFHDYQFQPVGSSWYQYTSYDAFLTLAIAACETPVDAFTATDLYEQIVKTEFDGISGHVSFNRNTRSRVFSNVSYRIQNLVVSDALSDAASIRFSADISAVMSYKNPNDVIVIAPFVYADNSTVQPPYLPQQILDRNLMSDGVRALGVSLCGIVMLSSVGWMIWTIAYRKKDVVRASQPIFLCQLCVGTLLMGLSIIPMSMQEPKSQKELDMACMATPWLISFGFVISFSALFSKTWRLNRLFLHGKAFRRVQVRARDVIYPFLILMTANAILLTVWTINEPLVWTRKVVQNVDRFDRYTESIGLCSSRSNEFIPRYIIPIFALDLAALVFANYQAYEARVLPTDFSESFYIAVSMGSLLETCFLAIPLLILSRDNPSVNFLISSILVSISCLGIQLPIFVPKFVQRILHDRRQTQSSESVAPALEHGLRRRIHVSGMSMRQLPRSRSFRRVIGAVGGAVGGAVSRTTDVVHRTTAAGVGVVGGAVVRTTDVVQRTTAAGVTRVRRSRDYYRQRAVSTNKPADFRPSTP